MRRQGLGQLHTSLSHAAPVPAAPCGALHHLLPQVARLRSLLHDDPITQPCPQRPAGPSTGRCPSPLGRFPLEMGWVGAGRRQPLSKMGGLAPWGATPTPPVGQEGQAPGPQGDSSLVSVH